MTSAALAEIRGIWRTIDRGGLPRFAKLNIPIDAPRLFDDYCRLWGAHNRYPIVRVKNSINESIEPPPDDLEVCSAEEHDSQPFFFQMKGGMGVYVEHGPPTSNIMVVKNEQPFTTIFGLPLPDWPYLRSFTQSFPFRSLDIIKFYDLAPGGILRSHVDLPHVKRDKFAINVTVSTGGSSLIVKLDDKVFPVTAPVYFFYCDAAHGVPMTTGRRLTLRLFGDLDLDRFWQLVDHSSIVK